MTYWDASAILKLYVTESDSQHFLELAETSEKPLISSAIAATEILCTLYRKEYAGELKSGANAAFHKFNADCEVGRISLLPYSGEVATTAEKLVSVAFERSRPNMIRTLDVIHLASAVASKADALVATDVRLRELAALAGLEVLP